MTRLPAPGGDNGDWGTLLNDFMQVAHNGDGSLKGVQTAYNIKDYGASGDGKTDDTAAFSHALSQIPASGGLLYIPSGTYAISRIALQQRRDLSIMGSGSSSVLAPFSGGSGLVYTGCTRCHLGNLRIDGSIHGGATGIEITGNFDAKLFNLHINDMAGDGILINGDDPAGTEIELSDVTCRNNAGYGYHYTRHNTADTGGMYLTNFRTLYNTRGKGGLLIESDHTELTPVFHMFLNTVADNYQTPAIILHNIAHCRFINLWAGGVTSSGIILIDGGGHMIEIDGAYITNGHSKGYNLTLNGSVNGILLDHLDFDGSPTAHVHVESNGANFFLEQYQIFGSSPLTDTPLALYRRSNFTMQHGPVVFATDSNGSFSTSVGFDDIRHPNRQKWIRNSNGTLQVLDTAYTRGLLELQDDGQLRWNDGAWISKHLSGTSTWTPGVLSAGHQVNTVVTVAGARVGDTVATGFSVALPGGMLISGAVTAPDTVTVTVFNALGETQTLPEGVLRADVWQH